MKNFSRIFYITKDAKVGTIIAKTKIIIITDDTIFFVLEL